MVHQLHHTRGIGERGVMISDETSIFGFELDFAGTLRCIPMAVRFKLDQCGVKLSLRQWSRFTREERAQLVEKRCDAAAAAREYRDYLVEVIETRAKDDAQFIEVGALPEWGDAARVPDRIAAWAEGLGVAAPTRHQWAKLTPLQRFSLFKLTRPGHDNDNFLPAMREFGLVA